MRTTPNQHKAQSAMEYLITYGWAILIIAVVLAVLFSLGLFNGSNLNGSVCEAAPGFLCSRPIYEHSDANIIVTLGQSTGANWANANFIFVPQGTPVVSGVPQLGGAGFSASPANTVLSLSGLESGNSASFYLPVNSISWNPTNVIVGSQIVGTIWAYYTTTYSAQGVQQSLPAYAQIATVSLKAS